MKAAKVVFGVMQGDALPLKKQRQDNWQLLLRQRRALRQRLHGCSEGMDLTLTMEIVRLSRQLRRTARAQVEATEAVSGRGAGEGVEAGSVVRMSEGSPGFSVAKD